MTSQEALTKIRELFNGFPAPAAPVPAPAQALQGEEYSLEDGSKIMISSLMVGGIVSLEDGTPAPDGEYKLADGTGIVVANGEISQVVPVEAPAEEAPAPAEEVPMADAPVDPVAAPAEEAAVPDEMAAMSERVAALEAVVAELMAKLGSTEEAMQQQTQQVHNGFKVVTDYIEASVKTPSADPIKKPSHNFEAAKAKQMSQFEAMKQAISNLKK